MRFTAYTWPGLITPERCRSRAASSSSLNTRRLSLLGVTSTLAPSHARAATRAQAGQEAAARPRFAVCTGYADGVARAPSRPLPVIGRSCKSPERVFLAFAVFAAGSTSDGSNQREGAGRAFTPALRLAVRPPSRAGNACCARSSLS